MGALLATLTNAPYVRPDGMTKLFYDAPFLYREPVKYRRDTAIEAMKDMTRASTIKITASPLDPRARRRGSKGPVRPKTWTITCASLGMGPE